jgi:hypothetical protein
VIRHSKRLTNSSELLVAMLVPLHRLCCRHGADFIYQLVPTLARLAARWLTNPTSRWVFACVGGCFSPRLPTHTYTHTHTHTHTYQGISILLSLTHSYAHLFPTVDRETTLAALEMLLDFTHQLCAHLLMRFDGALVHHSVAQFFEDLCG